MIQVNISGKIPVKVTKIQLENTVRHTFCVARRKPRGAISVSFVDDKRIKELNRRYRKMNRPTDVLAFPTTVGCPTSDIYRVSNIRSLDWGDVIIAPAYAKKEARRLEIPFQEDLFRLVAHGTLHLLGYDHLKKADEKRMFRLQEKVVREFRKYAY